MNRCRMVHVVQVWQLTQSADGQQSFGVGPHAKFEGRQSWGRGACDKLDLALARRRYAEGAALLGQLLRT